MAKRQCHVFYFTQGDGPETGAWGIGFEEPSNLEDTQLLVVANVALTYKEVSQCLEVLIQQGSLEQPITVREARLGIFNNGSLPSEDVAVALGKLITSINC